MAHETYQIAVSYDTETTNIQVGETVSDTRAFPVLFIALDLREEDLRRFTPGKRPSFFRYAGEFIAYLEDIIAWGQDKVVVPVCCAYNLMFDLEPLLFDLSQRYDMAVSAQSSTHVYTLDLLDEDGNKLLRFWDTYYLEMRGLAAMGETCGLAKATGDWDYSLIRAPETPLTGEELYYAGRDVEVIPAYLRYLLESNEWLQPEDLGCHVLTKTSLVRQTARNETGRLRLKRPGKRPISVQAMFERLCSRELARTYNQYALRKACFRGGLTFTAATWAGEVQRNVYSLDETSAHHAYINGHMVPVDFHGTSTLALSEFAEQVAATPLDVVLAHYEEPFGVAFHAAIRFRNMRLRHGSAFERMGIATLAESKFKAVPQPGWWVREADEAAEQALYDRGWYDRAEGAVFAFGKLMSADVCEVHVNELELWVTAQVYEWDAMEVQFGEVSTHFVKPPDYVTLLSNLLFERKQDMKKIVKNYTEGVPYPLDIPDSIPVGIADRLRAGEMSMTDVEGYYQSTVKGSFNGIYGTQAQDVFKPSFMIARGTGVIRVNKESVASPETYAEMREKVARKPILYTYGMRIVGGSRLPLVIGITLIDAAFGERVRILGGDTDSMKIACDGVTADDLMRALEPLHVAVRTSIEHCMLRLRKNFPKYASALTGVGEFEVEGEAWSEHMDAWNKARLSYDGERVHVTCAGLSRPKDAYNIADWFEDEIARGWTFERLAPLVLGWGVEVSSTVCHALERHTPEPGELFEGDVTDYTGRTYHVSAPQSIALYDSNRVLGDLEKGTNLRTVEYMKSVGKDVEERPRFIGRDARTGEPVFKMLTPDGWVDMEP